MTLRPLPKPAHTFYPKRGKFETFSANQMLAYAEQAVAAERERCIDIVAMFGGSVEIEAAIRRAE